MVQHLCQCCQKVCFYVQYSHSTICIQCHLTQDKLLPIKAMPKFQHSFESISSPQQLSESSSSSPPGCSTPDQPSQLLPTPRLEHRWSLRHYSKTISNITTCVGFKHCPWSQRWLLKVPRTGKRFLKEQGRTFTLEGYFSLCILFNQNKNFQISRCSRIIEKKRR